MKGRLRIDLSPIASEEATRQRSIAISSGAAAAMQYCSWSDVSLREDKKLAQKSFKRRQGVWRTGASVKKASGIKKAGR